MPENYSLYPKSSDPNYNLMGSPTLKTYSFESDQFNPMWQPKRYKGKLLNTDGIQMVNTGNTSTDKSGKSKWANFNDTLGAMGVGAKVGDFLGGMNFSDYDSFSEDEQASQSAVRGALQMIPGWGTAIAAATGLVDAIGANTGLNLSSLNKDDAEKAGIKLSGFNKFMNMLPGNSMIWGGLSAAFGNKRTGTLDVSDEALSFGSQGYSGTVSDLQSAKNLGNKRLFFGQTDKANSFIDSQRDNARILENLMTVNTQRKQSDYYQDLQNQNLNRYAGRDYLDIIAGKQGMKLMSIEEARRIIALRKTPEEDDIEKLQNGGNIPGISSSLLPEGSLHAHKNHLDELNPDLEDATKKGIPVMAAEGGEVTDQVAEVESDELVFRLEITQKLEELMKDGSEEAMIEAGKLVTMEVIENTVDNTGQITEENGNSNTDNK